MSIKNIQMNDMTAALPVCTWEQEPGTWIRDQIAFSSMNPAMGTAIFKKVINEKIPLAKNLISHAGFKIKEAHLALPIKTVFFIFIDELVEHYQNQTGERDEQLDQEYIKLKELLAKKHSQIWSNDQSEFLEFVHLLKTKLILADAVPPEFDAQLAQWSEVLNIQYVANMMFLALFFPDSYVKTQHRLPTTELYMDDKYYFREITRGGVLQTFDLILNQLYKDSSWVLPKMIEKLPPLNNDKLEEEFFRFTAFDRQLALNNITPVFSLVRIYAVEMNNILSRLYSINIQDNEQLIPLLGSIQATIEIVCHSSLKFEQMIKTMTNNKNKSYYKSGVTINSSHVLFHNLISYAESAHLKSKYLDIPLKNLNRIINAIINSNSYWLECEKEEKTPALGTPYLISTAIRNNKNSEDSLLAELEKEKKVKKDKHPNCSSIKKRGKGNTRAAENCEKKGKNSQAKLEHLQQAVQNVPNGNVGASDLPQLLPLARLESSSAILPTSQPTVWLASNLQVKCGTIRDLANAAHSKDWDASHGSGQILNDHVYEAFAQLDSRPSNPASPVCSTHTTTPFVTPPSITGAQTASITTGSSLGKHLSSAPSSRDFSRAVTARFPRPIKILRKKLRELHIKNPSSSLRQAMWHFDHLIVIQGSLAESALATPDQLCLMAAATNYAQKTLEQTYRFCLKQEQAPFTTTHNLKTYHKQLDPHFSTYPTIVKDLFLANDWHRYFYTQHKKWTSHTTFQVNIPPLLEKLYKIAEGQTGSVGELNKTVEEMIENTSKHLEILLKQTDVAASDRLSPREEVQWLKKAFHEQRFMGIQQTLENFLENFKMTHPVYSTAKQAVASLKILEASIQQMNKANDIGEFSTWAVGSLQQVQESIENVFHCIEYYKKGKISSQHELKTFAGELGINMGSLADNTQELSYKVRYPVENKNNSLSAQIIDDLEALKEFPDLEKGFKLQTTPKTLWAPPSSEASLSKVVEKMQGLLVETEKFLREKAVPALQEAHQKHLFAPSSKNSTN